MSKYAKIESVEALLLHVAHALVRDQHLKTREADCDNCWASPCKLGSLMWPHNYPPNLRVIQSESAGIHHTTSSRTWEHEVRTWSGISRVSQDPGYSLCKFRDDVLVRHSLSVSNLTRRCFVCFDFPFRRLSQFHTTKPVGTLECGNKTGLLWCCWCVLRARSFTQWLIVFMLWQLHGKRVATPLWILGFPA